VVDSIREYCSQKGLKVFPGLVNGEKAHKVTGGPLGQMMESILDIAATLVRADRLSRRESIRAG